jgi:hypothetical protein
MWMAWYGIVGAALRGRSELRGAATEGRPYSSFHDESEH